MAKAWRDPRVPADVDCVLRPLLERRAAETPDKVFALFADGSAWTYREAREAARRAAVGFHRLGVAQGDTVLSWLPNGPEALRVWFGLNYLGAVYVPINLAYRGGILEHVVDNADARLIVAHAQLLPRLEPIRRSRLADAVVVGGTVGAIDGLTLHDEAALVSADADLPPLARQIAPWDTQSIIYTSGTTGPSKGVMSSYLQLYSMGVESLFFAGHEDRCMVNLPLFRVGGTAAVYAMLAKGGSIAVVDAFDTARFWSTVRDTGTTTAILLGVMASFLAKQAPSPEDREHPLRTAIMVPLGEGDEHDCEVEPGAVGELIVRTDRPWAMNHGYFRNPEATARAWRNGWFHTGDAFRVDASGNYFFVDRMKDAIRRRGENIVVRGRDRGRRASRGEGGCGRGGGERRRRGRGAGRGVARRRRAPRPGEERRAQ